MSNNMACYCEKLTFFVSASRKIQVPLRITYCRMSHDTKLLNIKDNGSVSDADGWLCQLLAQIIKWPPTLANNNVPFFRLLGGTALAKAALSYWENHPGMADSGEILHDQLLAFSPKSLGVIPKTLTDGAKMRPARWHSSLYFCHPTLVIQTLSGCLVTKGHCGFNLTAGTQRIDVNSVKSH